MVRRKGCNALATLGVMRSCRASVPSGENTTIPIVDSADNASDAETAACGSIAKMTIMLIPSALSDDARRLPKRARIPTEDIMDARMHDIGMPAKTV